MAEEQLSTPETNLFMIPKNRIHLSRNLHAQTTPYPDARRWVVRSLFLIGILLLVGVYAFVRPKSAEQQLISEGGKQILGEQEKPVEFETYQVRRGDTLFNVSQKYEISWQTLAELNGLEPPYTLKIGQKLNIPKN